MLFYLTHYDTNPFPFLQTEMAEKGCELQILHNPTNHGEYVNALIGAWRAVRKAKKDDVIVTLTTECSAKKSAGTICHVIETCF